MGMHLTSVLFSLTDDRPHIPLRSLSSLPFTLVHSSYSSFEFHPAVNFHLIYSNRNYLHFRIVNIFLQMESLQNTEQNTEGEDSQSTSKEKVSYSKGKKSVILTDHMFCRLCVLFQFLFNLESYLFSLEYQSILSVVLLVYGEKSSWILPNNAEKTDSNMSM